MKGYFIAKNSFVPEVTFKPVLYLVIGANMDSPCAMSPEERMSYEWKSPELYKTQKTSEMATQMIL